LSRAKKRTPEWPRADARVARCCIQSVTKDGPIAREVSVGSLVEIQAPPAALRPFPASSSHQEAHPVAVHSFCCWAPYLLTE
jgi:hypothetical protein